MPIAYLPKINEAVCQSWTEQDREMYNKLDYYFAKVQLDYRKTWATWSRFLGNMPWTPNQGRYVYGIRKDPSPHLRQFAFPNPIADLPKKDIGIVNEVRVTAETYRHRFESQVFDWVPSFRDFLTDHVDAHLKDINEKMTRFEDIFYRSYIFHQAPYVYVCDKAGGGLTQAPQGVGNDAGTAAKTTAWCQAQAATLGANGYLSMAQLDLAQTIMQEDLRVMPYSGGTGQPGQDGGVDDVYVLVTSTEAWNQFKYDPWVLQNRPIDLNIITQRFRGKLWGKITCILEDLPLRMADDGTFPQPQTIEGNNAANNYGETVMDTTYTGAECEWAFLVGGKGYKKISVGPPPKDFAGNGMPKGFGKMFWNGEVNLTKNIMVPCLHADGQTIVYDTNKYGEKLQIIAQAVYGCIGVQPRNIMPILFKRKRGA